MPIPGTTMIAGGNINPSRFVKLSTAADFTVLECDAGERVFGVSQEGSDYPPLSDQSVSAYAAAAGETLRIYEDNEECLLTLGSGGATRGDLLTPDADGKGVTIAGNAAAGLKYFGAEALQSGAENERIRVRVRACRTINTAAS